MNHIAIHQQIGETFTNDVVDVQHGGNTTLSSVSDAHGLGDVAIAIIDKPRYRLVTKPAFERLSRLVEVDSLEAVQASDAFSATEYATALARQDAFGSALPIYSPSTSIANIRAANTDDVLSQVRFRQEESARFFQIPTARPLIVTPFLEAAPTILADRELADRSQSTSVSAMSAQNVGRSGSESLQYQSGAPSPGSIPGTVLDNTAWSDAVPSYVVMLASLVLLNVCYTPFHTKRARVAPLFNFFYHMHINANGSTVSSSNNLHPPPRRSCSRSPPPYSSYCHYDNLRCCCRSIATPRMAAEWLEVPCLGWYSVCSLDEEIIKWFFWRSFERTSPLAA